MEPDLNCARRQPGLGRGEGSYCRTCVLDLDLPLPNGPKQRHMKIRMTGKALVIEQLQKCNVNLRAHFNARALSINEVLAYSCSSSPFFTHTRQVPLEIKKNSEPTRQMDGLP